MPSSACKKKETALGIGYAQGTVPACQVGAAPARSVSLGGPPVGPGTQTSQGFFCFNDTATTEIYTLSLHDALPIFASSGSWPRARWASSTRRPIRAVGACRGRSEEHTSELQSRRDLVCRLLLE